jgi:GntR family transcriptional regulator
LQNLWSFPQLISESGHTPDIRALASYTRQPSIKEIASLELDPGHQVYVLERLFYADQIPVIYSTNIIPIKYFIDPQPILDKDLTIYEFMKAYCDLELIFSTSEIHSAKSDNQIGNQMQIQPNDPLICFQDLFFTRDGKPVVYGINYYNDQILTMRLVRSRV